ncbi:hypothetical protein [Thermithiobacillus plumbiphilus]|uniref:Transposase n=1 Tax=Thermithiobacillus plumbiphilus TaxID=1729899 RepID=A0ABU9DA45_9PROT
MHLSKEQTVHRIIERIEEQQRRIREERAKRQRGEPYLTEDQVRVEVAIKYLRIEASWPSGATEAPSQPRLHHPVAPFSGRLH